MSASSAIKLERFFYVFVCAILLLAVLHWAQPVVLPVMMALFLMFILNPVVRLLQRAGLPRALAAIVAAILLFVVIVCFFGFFIYQLNALTNDLPTYKTRVVQKMEAIRQSQVGAWIGNAMEFLADLKIGSDDRVATGNGAEPIPVRILDSALPWVQAAAGTTLQLLLNVSLVFLLLVFMLTQREDIRNRIIRLGGSRHLARTTRVFDEASNRISRYLAMQLLINCGVGVVLGAGLYVLSVPYAVVWGVLAAFARYIPYLGAWIAALCPLAVTMAVMPGWGSFFLALTLIAVVELVTANVIEPIFFGHSIGVTGLAILVTTVFWTWFWGPLGLLLATPLTAYLVVLGRHVPTLSFLSTLMGEEAPLDPHLNYFQRLLAKDPEEAAKLIADGVKSRSPEEVYDEVVLPAMNHALLEKDRCSMDTDDERFVLASTLAILQDVIWDPAKESDAANGERDTAPLQIVGVPVGDDADALLLDMFKESLVPEARMAIVAGSEPDVLSRIDEENPGVILFVAWSHRELMQAGRFCKRARFRRVRAKIVVCCWGSEQDPAVVREKLTAAGADGVGTTFAETRELLRTFTGGKNPERPAKPPVTPASLEGRPTVTPSSPHLRPA